MMVEELDPPLENFSDLDFTEMQEEVMKQQVGQPYRFVKLRLTDGLRTPDDGLIIEERHCVMKMINGCTFAFR
uniref:Mesoderm development candidate 2 n=1 Tax=Tanacetum cinerariifolium TaxID=118510 RepID=A0A699JGZ9_TANCI|nr:mesoderm development candidate 2 [Tanacetum cinerariifolium]